MSDCYVIAKNVLRPSEPQRRGRNLDLRFEYLRNLGPHCGRRQNITTHHRNETR
jgi:hypothetical protein